MSNSTILVSSLLLQVVEIWSVRRTVITKFGFWVPRQIENVSVSRCEHMNHYSCLKILIGNYYHFTDREATDGWFILQHEGSVGDTEEFAQTHQEDRARSVR